MSACVPILHTFHTVRFKNCTEDTLFIGLSYDDNVDSVFWQLSPCYNINVTNGHDTTCVLLWKNIKFDKRYFIYPDSICSTDREVLFHDNNDTSYFFLVKCENAKRYSWNEIRSRKLYRRVIITRDKDGKFDTDIKY